MKRKIKFPLNMGNEIEVRSLLELREHFNIEMVLQYFFDGKLNKWLKDRGHDYEIEQISKLNEDSKNLAEELCKAIGVDYKKYNLDVNIEEIKNGNNKINELDDNDDKIDESEVVINNKLLENIELKNQKRSVIYYELSNYISRKYGDDSLVKYINMLNFIDSNYKEIRDKFELKKDSIDYSNIYTEMDILEYILVIKRNNNSVPFREIYKLPLDIKVKLVYLLMGYMNKELDNLEVEEAAGFFNIFKRILSIESKEFILIYRGEFSLASARVMVRERHIFKKYLDSNYNR